jgi:hypothetical protein
MNHSFESENELLIVYPKPDDFKELKVKFEEKDAKIMYLAQVKEATDDNSYDTFVFYHKGDKSYIFHEHENPAHGSYETKTVIGKIDDYWKTLAEMEPHLSPGPFGKLLEISNHYKELDSLLANSQPTKIKRQKM